MDRSAVRRADMDREFGRARMTYTRVCGVVGADLPPQIMPYFCDPSGRIVTPLHPGEIGCYASHLLAWQQVATGDLGPAVLVCEDDIRLPENLAEVLSEIVTKAPAGWELMRLSSVPKRAVHLVIPLSGGRQIVRYSRHPALGGASLLTPIGARKLLAPGIRTVPVDQDLRRPWIFEIDAYGVEPRPIAQVDESSETDALGGRTWRSLQSMDPMELIHRLRYSLRTLGPWPWLRCAIWNGLGRKLVPAGAALTSPALTLTTSPPGSRQ
jgi:glycosyl transferase, family 25